MTRGYSPVDPPVQPDPPPRPDEPFTPGQQVREVGTGRTSTITTVISTRTADGRTVHALIVDNAVRPCRDFEAVEEETQR